jgi:hypothetical protein
MVGVKKIVPDMCMFPYPLARTISAHCIHPKTEKKRANPVKWICPAEDDKILRKFSIEDFSPP